MFKKLMICITAIALTSGLTQAQDWEWIETGYNFILTDVQFPLGQSQIGYAVGMNSTYNGDGIVLKTIDGGDTWTQSTGATTSANMIAYASQNVVLGVGGERTIWRSTNGGSS